MKFRPCIDIHNGKVKQIIGGSLRDERDQAKENFTSSHDADYYADMYRRDGLSGGHIILLNPVTSPYYADTLKQAQKALAAYPGGMQIGGGITAENAKTFLDAGASHVIVTSYVFRDGKIRWEHIGKLMQAVGKERIVIDLSCRKRDNAYYIVTDRWQKFTKEQLTVELLEKLHDYCDEFLVHGVDVEGCSCGVDESLAQILGSYKGIPVTYAGGIASLKELEHFRKLTDGKIDYTIGSALDIFGGNLAYESVRSYR